MVLLLIAVVFALAGPLGTVRIPYSTFLAQVDSARVVSVVVGPEEIHGLMHPAPATWAARTSDTVAFVTTRVEHATLLEMLRAHGVRVDGARSSSLWRELTGWLLPVLIMYAAWRFVWRPAAQVSEQGVLHMGESRAHVYVEKETRVHFGDVAGVDDAKGELREIVDFLRDPVAYGRLGARMPRGILLVGEPGTGKTLLARAVAGESGVPFYYINGSEFVELFVGIGAARVRHLFAQAREHAPCILFIDEIDALGKSRGPSVISGGSDEKEQTLNQLLAELDGFDPRSGVVLLAATNRPDTLDPALLRAGRFDRQVFVDRPDREGREQILAVHVRRVQLDPACNLATIAALTPGFTGADLANLANEAALVATRRRAASVTLEDFTEAVERIVAGTSRSHRLMSASDRERTACHEMGHALVALAIPGADPVQKVSIIPRAIGALGFTMQRPTEDRYVRSRDQLDHELTILMAGRAAELMVFRDLSTGAADDLVRATELANHMVARFGMDERVGHAVHLDREGTRMLAPNGGASTRRVGSEATLREIDVAVRERLQLALDRAVALLATRRDALEAGRRLMAERETMSGAEIEALVVGDGAPRAGRSRASELLKPRLTAPRVPSGRPLEEDDNVVAAGDRAV